MKRVKIIPSAIVLAFALSSCASTEAVAPVETPLAEAAPTDIASAIALARSQREAGELDAATATLSQLVLVAPDDPRILGEYGKTLVDRGDITDALAFLQRAIELDQGEWTYHSAQGIAFAQARDHRSASIAFSRALAISPEQPTVLNNFALSQMQAGNLDQAEALLLRATAGGPSPRIEQNLAMVREMKVARGAVPAAVPSAPSLPGKAPEAVAMTVPEVPSPEAVPVPAPAPVEVENIEPLETSVPEEAATAMPEAAPAPIVPAAALSIPGVAEGTVRVQALPARETEAANDAETESAIISVEESPSAETWLPASGPIYIQVGSFSSAENAGRFAEELAELNPSVTILNVGERELHRVSVGPYAQPGEARLALASLELHGVHDVQVLSSMEGGVSTATSAPPQAPDIGPGQATEAEPQPAPAGAPSDGLPALRFSENR